MRQVMSVMSALLFAAAASGCSDSIGPTAIAGTWRHFAVAGSSLQMTLSLNGSTVSGPGTWCGEALGCGTTSVTGTATGNQVHLVTTFDNGEIETFDGSFKSSNSLEGSAIDISPGGQTQLPFAQTYQRITVLDPPIA
jgi:hypothetical protein